MIKVVSERGKAKLVFQHNIYFKDGINNIEETVYWRCNNRHKSSCKARVHTVNAVVTKQLMSEMLNSLNWLRLSRNDDATMGLSAAVGAQIVKKNLKRTIQQPRVGNEAAPANPHNCAELDIPDTFKEIILDEARGAQLFLQYDPGAEEHWILIFGTEQSKVLLEMSEMWQCDGTFKVTPPLFSQLYSIHATR